MEKHTTVKEGLKNLKVQIKAKWDKLTDTDLNDTEKNLDLLSERVQKAYGHTKDVVDKQVSDFRKTLSVKPELKKAV